MNLADLWFVIVAVLWTGFFVLEGFDFGVGALHSVVGRSEFERRAAINTVGPFWDANEVWLVVGAAAIFAAFPAWYATWFSAAYLPIVVLLVALIFRGIAFEWRGRGRSDRSRWLWSLGLTLGSVVAPTVLGIAFGALLAGIPINSEGEFTGSVWDLFSGFALWTGLTVLLLCLFHGATFLALRTTDDICLRARRYGRVLAIAVFVVVAVFAVWMLLIAEAGIVTYVLLGIAFAGIVVAFVGLVRRRDGLALTASTFAVAATIASLFTGLHPDVLVSSTSSAYSLTVAGSASGEYALTVMTIVVAVFLPIVLLYQGYTYVVFRRRISGSAPSVFDGTSDADVTDVFGRGAVARPARAVTSRPAKRPADRTTKGPPANRRALRAVCVETRWR